MALIICSECEKEYSDKATACPNCGCPTGISDNIPGADDTLSSTQQNSTTEKLWGMVQGGVQTLAEKNKNAIKATKQVGPVQIDESHKMFRINGAIPVNGKKDGIGKTMFNGMMAIGTIGVSVAAGKLIGGGNKQKVGNKEWLDFSDLINYELLEDDSIITSGGVGQALVGGALFGGFGAVAGGITGKRKQNRKIESLHIKVTLNNFGYPCIMIPLITKSTKTDCKEYQTAFNLAHQILSIFDVITHNQ